MTLTVSVAMMEPALQLRKGKERMKKDNIVVDLVQEREPFIPGGALQSLGMFRRS